MRKDLHRLLLLAGALTCVPTASATVIVEWERQPGTPYSDEHFNMAVDSSGNVLIAGRTQGIFGTTATQTVGNTDAFVAKLDPDGNALWAQTLGGPANDGAWGVVTDVDENVYITGLSQTGIGGPPGYGTFSYLAKYDASGSPLWTSRVNTLIPGPFFTYSVVPGNDNDMYTAGHNFFNRIDSEGNVIWTRGISWPGRLTYVSQVAPDEAGNLYVSGRTTTGSDEISDVFLAKYDESGNEIWHRVFGSSARDNGGQILMDELGGVYVAGSTLGDFAAPNAGGSDIFVTRWDANGNLIWQTQFGTEESESARLTAAPDGGVYFAGTPSLPDSPLIALFGEINVDGVVLWKEQYELDGSYPAGGIVTFDEGPVAYYATSITGSPHEVSAFSRDIFLVKLSIVPEPSAMVHVAIGALLSLLRNRFSSSSSHRPSSIAPIAAS